MNLKQIKLTDNDMKLLRYLARFKLMSANNAIIFYGSSYYQKRLQELKNANYITRYYKSYIKLNPASIRFLESQNIKCEHPCRNKEYIERLQFINQIGLGLLGTDVKFKLSWEMKGSDYTDWSRRFLGEIELRGQKYIVYYAKNDFKYLRLLHFDINKDLTYENVLVLIDDLNIIDKKNHFIFPNKASCIFISKKRIRSLVKFNKLDIKNTIENMFQKETTYSDFNFADYKIEGINIVYMPYVDTHRITAINNFYSMGMTDSKIQIVSYKENFNTIIRLLSENVKEKCTYREIKEATYEKCNSENNDNNISMDEHNFCIGSPGCLVQK